MFQSVKDGNYDEQDKMGMITFKTNRKLKVYYKVYYNDTQITDINIDKVKLSIMEGVIADVKIYPSESSGYDGCNDDEDKEGESHPTTLQTTATHDLAERLHSAGRDWQQAEEGEGDVDNSGDN